MNDHGPDPPDQPLPRDPQTAAALAEIRRLYFSSTRATIEHDFCRAIDLMKAMSGPEARERAAVYMDGLAQMRAEWAAGSAGSGARRKPRRPGGAEDPPLPE